MPAVTTLILRKAEACLKASLAIVVTASALLLSSSPASANPNLRTLLKSPIGRALLASDEGVELLKTMQVRHRALQMSREQIASLRETEFQGIFDDLAESLLAKTQEGRAGHLLEEQLETIFRYADDTMERYRILRRERAAASSADDGARAADETLFGLTLDEHILARIIAERRLAMKNRSWVLEALEGRTNFVSRYRARLATRRFFLNKEPPELIRNLPEPTIVRTAAQANSGPVRRAARRVRNLWTEMRSCLANQPESAASKDWSKFLYQEVGLGWFLTGAFHAQREGVNRGAADGDPLTNPGDFLKAIQVGYRHVRLRDLGTDIIMGTISDLAKFWGMDRYMRGRTGLGYLDPNLRFDVIMIRGWAWQQTRNMLDMGFYFILPTNEVVRGASSADIAELEAQRAQLVEDTFQRYEFNTVWSGMMAPITPSLIMLNQGIMCMVTGNKIWHKLVRGLTGVTVRGIIKTELSYRYFKLRNEHVYGDNPTPIDTTERSIQDLLRAPSPMGH